MNLIRTIFLIALGIYSLQFFTWDVNEDVMNAFIHGPNLIFHEAGHVFFMPFGDFFSILGGSFFQVLLPIILTYVFLIREDNPFAASVTLWWTGQNLTDVALYISDASARALPLIGGMSEEAHDWGNLLMMTNMLEYDHVLGLLIHYTGMIVMIAGLVWGLYICFGDLFIGKSNVKDNI